MQAFKKIAICIGVLVTCSTIFSTAGCRLLRPAPEKIVHDNVTNTITRTERDTVLVTKKATVTMTVQLPCPEAGKTFDPLIKKNVNALLKLAVIGNTLTADCECDTVALKAKLYDTFQKSSHIRTETSTRTVEVKYVPGWVKFLAWSGGIFWPLFLLGVYIKYINSKP